MVVFLCSECVMCTKEGKGEIIQLETKRKAVGRTDGRTGGWRFGDVLLTAWEEQNGVWV